MDFQKVKLMHGTSFLDLKVQMNLKIDGKMRVGKCEDLVILTSSNPATLQSNRSLECRLVLG
jgi:hypothetical protein